ncbi:MAG: acyl-CoA dehydrogenase family protein [Pseudomonadota bacterium]
MNFDLTEEQNLFVESVRRFAYQEPGQGALQRAHENRFPFDVAERMSEVGLLGITVDAEKGGY